MCRWEERIRIEWASPGRALSNRGGEPRLLHRGSAPEEGDRAAARERVRTKYFPAKIRELPAQLAGRGDEAEGGIFFSGTKKKTEYDNNKKPNLQFLCLTVDCPSGADKEDQK